MTLNESKKICIIGAGMQGLVAAHMLLELDYKVNIYDSLSDPSEQDGKRVDDPSPTFGQGGDVRHITGSEGLTLQPWLKVVDAQQPVTCAIEDEDGQHFIHDSIESAKYFANFDEDNVLKINLRHTALNNAGLGMWGTAQSHFPEVRSTSNGYLPVMHKKTKMAKEDFELEQKINPDSAQPIWGKIPQNILDFLDGEYDSDESLSVPAYHMMVKKLGLKLIQRIKDLGGNFMWNTPIEKETIPKGYDIVINASSRWKQYSTFLIGFWINVKDPESKLFNSPFKFVDANLGYLNVTPYSSKGEKDSNDMVAVSGGFFYFDKDDQSKNGKKYIESAKAQFLEAVGTRVSFLKEYSEPILCLRPNGIFGLPCVELQDRDGVNFIDISGGGKAGTTLGPSVALLAIQKLGLLDAQACLAIICLLMNLSWN